MSMNGKNKRVKARGAYGIYALAGAPDKDPETAAFLFFLPEETLTEGQRLAAKCWLHDENLGVRYGKLLADLVAGDGDEDRALKAAAVISASAAASLSAAAGVSFEAALPHVLGLDADQYYSATGRLLAVALQDRKAQSIWSVLFLAPEPDDYDALSIRLEEHSEELEELLGHFDAVESGEITAAGIDRFRKIIGENTGINLIPITEVLNIRKHY